MTVNRALPPEARALLDTIAGTESPGYNVIYGGRRFGDYSDHPRVSVPIRRGVNAGKTSSAAGRYQFLGSTWDSLGLPDFSPMNQDVGAWKLAQRDYKAKTGNNLLSDLRRGDIGQIGKVLSSTWTSLPSGIEAGTNVSKFGNAFYRNLGQYADSGQIMTDVPAQDDYNPFASHITKRQDARKQAAKPQAEDGYNPFAKVLAGRKQQAQPAGDSGFNMNPLSRRPVMDASQAPQRDALVDFGAGVARGLKDVGAGINRINQTVSAINPISRAANVATGGATDQWGNDINEANKASIEAYKAGGFDDSGSAGFGRFVGNVLPSMLPGTNLPAVTGVMPNVLRGASMGAMQNAIIGGGRNPESSIGQEAAIGAGFGAAGSAVGAALPKMVGAGKAATSMGDTAPVKGSAIEKLIEFSGGHPTRLASAIEQGNKTLVPGAAPTVAQAAMLPGISQLERTLVNKGAAGGASPLLDRQAMQEVARLSALGNIADVSGLTAIDAAQAAGSQIGSQVRGAHAAAKAETRAAYNALSGQDLLIPTEGKAEGILAGVFRQQEPHGELGKIAKILDSNSALSFDDLQSLREDVADLAWRAKTGNVSQGSKVQRSANQIKEYIDGMIDKHAGSAFGDAKQARIAQGKTFERGFAGDITKVKPSGDYKLDDAAIMQKLLQPSGNQAAVAKDFLAVADDASRDAAVRAAMADITEKAVRGSDGAERILPQTLSGYVDKRSQLLQQLLSPEEYAALQAVKNDAVRSASATSLGMGVGSPTAQNLFSLGVLDNPFVNRAIGSIPGLGGYAQGALAQAKQAGEANMVNELAKLMADPKFTREALKKWMAAQKRQAVGGKAAGLLSVPASQGLLDQSR